MADRVVLIDGSNLIFRAFFAVPSNLSTATGLHTNATYGFALMFRKILAGKMPKYGAVVFDAPGGSFRDQQYPQYKADRPAMSGDLREQLPWIHQVVEAHDFPMLRVAGFEADDVIGTLTKQALAAGMEVHIISGDKDFSQLIGPTVRVIDTMRDITYDEELVRKKWGVRPHQFVDLLAIMGDDIDNIPGVKGIGQKGAAGLLETYGSLDGVYEHIDALKGKQKNLLVEQKEQALLSRELATIHCDTPIGVTLEDLVLPEPDQERINVLYKELEFFSLLTAEEAHSARAIADEGDFATVESLSDLEALLAKLPTEPISIVEVYEPPSFVTGELNGIAIGLAPGKARYVPLFGTSSALGSPGLARLRTMLEDPAVPKVVHDLRDLWTLLKRHGVEIQGVVGDTQLASFLVDPTKNVPHRLDQITKQYLHRTLTPLKDLVGAGQSQRRIADVPVAECCTWACHVATAVLELWPPVRDACEREGQTRLLHDLDMPLAVVLGRMQLDGIRVDPDDLRAMGVEFETRKLEVERRIYELAGHEFNIGSTKQLAVVLFEELELPVLKRTKTGYSTDADVLERLAPKHEIVQHVLRQRTLAKLINTYTEVLSSSVNPKTGRIHATFQQTTGVSGRLITTDPDLQRTPIRTEDGKRIRRAFIPQNGWLLISADWSQIELRVLAHYTKDAVLRQAFTDNVDVHRLAASRIFDVAPEAVTPEQRNVGKTVNFATIYGQGATALGQSLGISRNDAKAIIDRYFEQYAGVARWIDETVDEASRTGFVTTILGRRRYIPELSSNNMTDRAYGERIAANSPIQGSAADLCKLAMLKIAEQIRSKGMQTRMLVQIHDELLFEAPPDELDAAESLVREAMEHPYPLEVPLVVGMGHGASWAEAH